LSRSTRRRDCVGSFARPRSRSALRLHLACDAPRHSAVKAVRRLSLVALGVACLHLVFGAIVRISGSGMGCGDHWPKCYGRWFPPLDRPDLIVEVSHRYLASILTLAVLSMAAVAFARRGEPGIGGPGGALRSAFGAV